MTKDNKPHVSPAGNPFMGTKTSQRGVTQTHTSHTHTPYPTVLRTQNPGHSPINNRRHQLQGWTNSKRGDYGGSDRDSRARDTVVCHCRDDDVMIVATGIWMSSGFLALRRCWLRKFIVLPAIAKWKVVGWLGGGECLKLKEGCKLQIACKACDCISFPACSHMVGVSVLSRCSTSPSPESWASWVLNPVKNPNPLQLPNLILQWKEVEAAALYAACRQLNFNLYNFSARQLEGLTMLGMGRLLTTHTPPPPPSLVSLSTLLKPLHWSVAGGHATENCTYFRRRGSWLHTSV